MELEKLNKDRKYKISGHQDIADNENYVFSSEGEPIDLRYD